MMFLTPGTSFTPRCTACETIFCVTLTLDARHAGQLPRAASVTCLRIGSIWLFAG